MDALSKHKKSRLRVRSILDTKRKSNHVLLKRLRRILIQNRLSKGRLVFPTFTLPRNPLEKFLRILTFKLVSLRNSKRFCLSGNKIGSICIRCILCTMPIDKHCPMWRFYRILAYTVCSWTSPFKLVNFCSLPTQFVTHKLCIRRALCKFQYNLSKTVLVEQQL